MFPKRIYIDLIFFSGIKFFASANLKTLLFLLPIAGIAGFFISRHRFLYSI